MALTRPLKEGSATTYQQKVSLGFPDILASEVDADLDTIYAAWNGGIATANLIDGSVTTPKLASAPNGVGTTNLNDLAVTTAKLANGAVTLGKLAVGLGIRQSVAAGLPASFAGTATAWATVLTMPTITTVGGVVLLIASGGWSAKAPQNTDCSAQVRWIRNPGAVAGNTLIHAMNAGSTGLPNFPLPPLISLEQPAAGTWTYVVQYQLASASFLVTPASGGGLCWVVEFL
jgi:hypothetical protein